MPVVIGQQYTKLIPKYKLPAQNKHKDNIFHCECACGNEINVTEPSLLSGNTRSCGCLRSESAKKAGFARRKRNKYDLSGAYGIGWTTNTNKEFYFDIEDFPFICDYNWKENDSGYIVMVEWDHNKSKTIRMHRWILEKNNVDISEKDVDHHNHKTFDNQKRNLRVCTHYENIVSAKNILQQYIWTKGSLFG